MTTPDTFRGALAAVERVLNRGGDADDVLREVVAILHDRIDHYASVGIRFVEGEDLVVGPSAGPMGSSELAVAVQYEGSTVGELVVSPGRGEGERPFLERVATLISPYCLVGWDTGGEHWQP